MNALALRVLDGIFLPAKGTAEVPDEPCCHAPAQGTMHGSCRGAPAKGTKAPLLTAGRKTIMMGAIVAAMAMNV